MKLLDRISGQEVPLDQLVGKPTVPQRYVLCADWSTDGHRILSKGSVLCGDNSQFINLAGYQLTTIEAEPSDNVRNALKEIVLTMEECLTSGQSLPSPLIPRAIFQKSSQLSELEAQMEEVVGAGHLHQISARPRIDMYYEDELMPVSRAKKVAHSAHRYLAMRSETWQQRTLTGIYPKKILSKTSQDDWRLYENKVYARLIDKLLAFLRRRRTELLEQQKNMDEGLDLNESERLFHRLRHDLFLLWGENWSTAAVEATLNALKDTMEIVNRLIRTLQGLQQHGLYVHISSGDQVPNQLHMTNILSHDQDYRHVARLWSTWLAGFGKTLSRNDRLRENCRLQDDYIRFAALVVCRSFISLGYTVKRSSVVKYEFERESYRVTMQLDKTHSWVLCNSHVHHDFRVVPILVQPNGIMGRSIQDQQELLVFHLLTNVTDYSDVASRPEGLHASPLNFHMIEAFTRRLVVWMYQDMLRHYAAPMNLGRLTPPISKRLDATPGIQRDALGRYALVNLLDDRDMAEIRELLDQSSLVKAQECLDRVHAELMFLVHCPLCGRRSWFQPWEKQKFQAKCQNAKCGVEYAIKDGKDSGRYFTMGMPDYNELEADMGRWNLTILNLDTAF